MKILSNTLILLLLTVARTQAEWSWGAKNEEVSTEAAAPELLQGEDMIASETTQSNVTVLDDIVDEIISSKQGRSLNRDFDEVYSDPTIKEALESGDDLQARNLIKERLCTLGLMQCDNEYVLEKRPYVAPEDLIYAQPVDIQPIGRPVASIPIRGPPRAYHQQPKPSLYPPPRPQKIPPRKVGYGPPKPGYAADKYGQVSSGSYNGNFGNSDVIYGQKPHVLEGPYAYESSRPSYGKPQTIPIPISQSTGGIKGDGTVQQHVHHHYVHGDSDKNPKVIIKPVPVPANGPIHQPNENFDTYDGGFKPMSGPYSPGVKPVYEQDQAFSTYNKNPYQQTVNAQYNTNGEYDTNSLNGYGNDFYKKEFNLGQSGNNLGPQTFDFNKGSLQEPRAPEFDCVCVPFDQCPNQEVIGKRDDLILPIDPRHKNSAIEAITDDQLENSTLSGGIESTSTESPKSNDDSDSKRVSKREVKGEMRGDGIEETEEKKIEPRSYDTTGSYGRTFGSGNKNVQPTFGVSFGLPQSSYGGYPLNPLHSNPIQNPYGPAINGGGLNLGLISVNPLLSLQVSKDENGDKVLKPYVNIHVTPNEHVVNKIGHLINEKKYHLLNKHEHYHHFPYKPQYHYSQHVPYQHHHAHPHYQTIHKPVYYHHTFKNTPEVSENYFNDYTNDMLDNLGLDLQENGFDNSVFTSRAGDVNITSGYAQQYNTYSSFDNSPSPGANRGGKNFRFPNDRRKRATVLFPKRQGFYNPNLIQQQCRQNQVCCRRPLQPSSNRGQCGIRHSQGINGRIKTPSYVDGESEFGEYPWQAAILKKDPKESVYVCGGTLIDHQHIITAAHCVKQYNGFDLRVRLGEWDVNHDVEFFPYIERDVVSVHVHPKYYAGTLDNDLAILKLDAPVDYTKYPHISPACLPDKYTEYAGQRCWTTGWGKDAFGDYGKYQNILKEVDVPVLSHGVCQQQLRNTRLGYNYVLNPGFVCAGGEEGKDACKGDGGGPMVCERGGTWQVVGVVSWGIGCGQVNVPGVYVKVSHYLDWISQVTGRFSQF